MSDDNTQVIAWSVNDARIAEIGEEIGEVDAYKDLEYAKKAKKTLTTMRTTLAEAHKKTKAEALAFGRKCDAEKNRLLALIAKIEDPITKQLNEIKEAEDRKEAERLEKIESAIQEIHAYSTDRHDLDLATLETRIENLTAYEITEEVFQERTETAQLLRDEGLMKLRISLKGAQERAEEARKQAQIAEENARKEEELRKEREAFEEQKRKAAEEEEAKAAEARKAEEAKLAAERAELAEKQKAIDEENARIAKEKADKEAEEKRRAEEARKLALAPDHDKLIRLADELAAHPMPAVDSDEAKRVLVLVVEKMAPVIEFIRTEARKMK